MSYMGPSTTSMCVGGVNQRLEGSCLHQSGRVVSLSSLRLLKLLLDTDEAGAFKRDWAHPGIL